MKADVVGCRYGQRTVLADVEPDGRGRHRVRWICDCGRVGETLLFSLRKTSACMACRRAGKRDSTKPDTYWFKGRAWVIALLAEARERCPDVWLGDTPESSEAVRELVSLVGPMTRHEIAALIGVSGERVRQIEEDGMRRMRKRLRLVGVTAPDFCEAPERVEPEPYGDVA